MNYMCKLCVFAIITVIEINSSFKKFLFLAHILKVLVIYCCHFYKKIISKKEKKIAFLQHMTKNIIY